jgi:spore coat polysaccharide biosynthesis protein SpsF
MSGFPARPRVGVIVAARMGSSRLPGKALKPLAGVPSLAFLLRRLRSTRLADGGVVLATTTRPDDDALADLAADEGTPVFRGSEHDLVDRYVGAAAAHGFDLVVRITADCPFVDGESLDFCLAQWPGLAPFDIAGTKTVFPVGIDYELYRADLMAALNASDGLDADDREHLTLHFYRNPDRFTARRFTRPADWPTPPHPLTLDTPEDYIALSQLAAATGGVNAPVRDILAAATP